jgi:hypothetical protein
MVWFMNAYGGFVATADRSARGVAGHPTAQRFALAAEVA